MLPAKKYIFNRQGISDLLIDFKAESSQIKNVLANGKKVAYKFENEHIISHLPI